CRHVLLAAAHAAPGGCMRGRLRILLAVLLAAVAMPMALRGQIGPFAPDWTLKGAALTGTQQMGQATWKADNGEIVATATGPDGGWLLLSGGYQDVQVGGEFRGAGDCKRSEEH